MKRKRRIPKHPVTRPAAEIDDIIRITTALEQFWRVSHGWAPVAAAQLLAEARLDRQASFANTLHDYLTPFPPEVSEARRILGYTILRSLCEGALKLFFSAWFEDYRKDQDAVYKKQTLVSPEDVKFDRLIVLYRKNGEANFEPFLRRIQQRGNAIHHFSDHAIGTQSELIADILEFKRFLLAVNSQLPYPDGFYNPGNA